MSAATDRPDLPACLCDSLRQTTRAVTRMYDDALRPAKLRITQFSVLAYLVRNGEARVRDLGAGLVLEETSLTRSLRPLEERGLVRSRPGDDRRERYVSITAEGRQVLAKAEPLWSGVQERLRERLSAASWQGLTTTLPRAARAAQSA